MFADVCCDKVEQTGSTGRAEGVTENSLAGDCQYARLMQPCTVHKLEIVNSQ